ncbi:MAG TPA: hypothetical protein PK055_08855 [Gammaproteobacteria bacterium]|nr:hypothetical protein [Xanthomonadales bacterium]MCB1593341.1 hypothetical protein [Xanthomonadales bacterium]HOP22692.1 hypothetical protein [Gammaproteobacteria bacterium]HPI96276.1 hypothetical protein [Gammaproteobacteria bacterium]HPQ87754.1 hypothetical protein [Gammaproteobacteria bacterium]
MEIYIKSLTPFEELVAKLKTTVDLPNLNIQKRYGLNIGGGQYFLFTTGNQEIVFCRNHGEVEIDEMHDYGFYIWVFEGEETALHAFQTALHNLNIEHEIGDWI